MKTSTLILLAVGAYVLYKKSAGLSGMGYFDQNGNWVNSGDQAFEWAGSTLEPPQQLPPTYYPPRAPYVMETQASSLDW